MCYLSLSIYIFISIYLSNYLSICLSVWLSVCLSILSYPIQANLSIHPSIHLSIYLSIFIYLYIYIYTFISLHLYRYIYIFTFISLHLYLYIYIYLSFFFLIYIYVCIFTVKHLLIWIHRTLQLLDQVRLDVAAARARSKATLQAGRNRSPCLARHWGMVSYWVYRGFTMGLPGLPDSIQAWPNYISGSPWLSSPLLFFAGNAPFPSRQSNTLRLVIIFPWKCHESGLYHLPRVVVAGPRSGLWLRADRGQSEAGEASRGTDQPDAGGAGKARGLVMSSLD